MAHTPGPWFVEGERVRKHCMKDGLITIAKVEGWLSEYRDEEIANRNIIAAAPDMKEALDLLIDEIPTEVWEALPQYVQDKVIAAQNKAQGA